MALTKKRKAARDREDHKRRLKGWTPNGRSDTEYSSSDDLGGTTDDDSSRPTMAAPLESMESEDEESDGSDLLDIEESVVDSDDWDPTFQPLSGVCPLFTRPVCTRYLYRI